MAKVSNKKKKTIKEVVTIVTDQPKSLWQKVKDKFYNSESIALAYLAQISGVVVGAIGYFDFSPIWSMFQTGTEFTKQQLLGIGIGVTGAGIAAYFARTRGTKEVSGRLLPTAEK